MKKILFTLIALMAAMAVQAQICGTWRTVQPIVENAIRHGIYGRTVWQVVRVSDGKELIHDGNCRPCDSLDDAIDVAGEMIVE